MSPGPFHPLLADSGTATWQSVAAIVVVVATVGVFAWRWWKRLRGPGGKSACGGGSCGCGGNFKPRPRTD